MNKPKRFHLVRFSTFFEQIDIDDLFHYNIILFEL